MTHHRFLLIPLLVLGLSSTVQACVEAPRPTFRDVVGVAHTIFVFQLMSATYERKDLGGGAWMEYVVGQVKVLDSLKGNGNSFKTIKYSFRGCNSTRMSVGQFYLAGTSQSGQTLELWGNDVAILDLTRDFYTTRAKRSPAVDIVKKIIGGAPIPVDFPREALESPLLVYPVPSPPLDPYK